MAFLSEMAVLPDFPPQSVRERVDELGYGTGPWSREQLEERWSASVANRFIQEAKDYGWLVSPFRGEFYVPPAQDLTIVSWLPARERQEFILSRTLAAAGFRFWCFSAWARRQGLEFGFPLFVTDLQPRPNARQGNSEWLTPAKDLIERNRRIASELRALPYLESLIIVPELPPTSMAWERETYNLQRKSSLRLDSQVDRQDSTRPSKSWWPQQRRGLPNASAIRYVVSPSLKSVPWLIAFLSALDMPRIRENLIEYASPDGKYVSGGRGKEPDWKAVLQEAKKLSTCFGRPMPNKGWKDVLESGQFPYLLLPHPLWDEILSSSASRTYQALQDLAGDSNA